MVLPGDTVVKNLPTSAEEVRDISLIPGSGSSFGEGNGYPLRYSCLENFMGREACRATVLRFRKSWTRVSMFAMP